MTLLLWLACANPAPPPATTTTATSPPGEQCDNGADDDDDGLVDCFDPDCPISCDADGDGALPVSLGGGDCNDADASIHPGAVEVCEDGVDQDCWDGDPLCLPLLSAMAHGEAPGDRAGVSVALGDIDGDGSADTLVAAPGHPDGGRAYAAVYGATWQPMGQWPIIVDNPGIYAEIGLVGVTGDLDGDGLDDWGVGAVGAATGVAWIFAGGPVAPIAADARATLVWDGDPGAGFPGRLTGAGLVATTAPGAVGGAGQVLAFPRQVSGVVPTSAAPISVSGAPGDALAGAAVADFDGDGVPDLAFGAPGADGGAGAVWVWSSPSGARATTDAFDAEWTGLAGDGAGSRVQATADLDGDGLPEVATGALGALSGRGAVYVAAMSPGTQPLSAAEMRFEGDGPGAAFGTAFTATPPQGGYQPAFWIGAEDAADGAGRVYLFRDALVGVHAASDGDWRDGFAPGDHLGHDLAEATAVMSCDGIFDAFAGSAVESGPGYVELLAPGELD